MNNPDHHDSKNHTARAANPDLDWLAERFVLGELPLAEEEAVVASLSDDDDLAAAVARASKLVTAVRAAALTSPVASLEPAPRSTSGRWLAVPAVAAAAAWIIWLSPALRPGTPPALPGSREVVELWRESAEPAWATEESPADNELHTDPDTAPDWMLAAVSLDAAGVGEPEVLEN
ncbi:MAG: hypothetical protein WD072_02450 [Pirellulales bacterium]